jgi:hypothetical protein
MRRCCVVSCTSLASTAASWARSLTRLYCLRNNAPPTNPSSVTCSFQSLEFCSWSTLMTFYKPSLVCCALCLRSLTAVLTAVSNNTVEIIARTFKNLLREKMRQVESSESDSFLHLAVRQFNMLLGLDASIVANASFWTNEILPGMQQRFPSVNLGQFTSGYELSTLVWRLFAQWCFDQY